ncbi:MAG: ABC transporter ATP-binding protein [Arenicella sp.]
MSTKKDQNKILEVQNLQTYFDTKAGLVKSVDGVNLSISKGEILGVVGESGSGKSVTGFSIMGLIDKPGKIKGGKIIYYGDEANGVDLVSSGKPYLRSLRGAKIAMIFQDPMMSLNPVLRIDTQMIEAITSHVKVSRKEALERARQALVKVGISSPDERLKSYPHQFSGGMRQRVAIATALLNEPDIIIADEPTTALDVTVQAQILYEVKKLCRESGTALIWVTHDLALVSGLADRVAVMYAGRIVETGSIKDIVNTPRHPYTVGLMKSVPSNNKRGEPLFQIPGMAPSLANLPQGCSFRPRCQYATEECWQIPEEKKLNKHHLVSCFNPEEA